MTRNVVERTKGVANKGPSAPRFIVGRRVKAAFFWCVCGLFALLAGYQTHKRLQANRLRARAHMRPLVRSAEAPLVTARQWPGEGQVALAPQEGKWALVHFWATWCAVCRAEMPSLRHLQTRLGNQLTVLAVAVDADTSSMEEFFADSRPSMRILLDPKRQASDRYGVRRFPESFLVSPQGRIRVRFSGPRDWSSALAAGYLQDVMRQ
ncbi:MAG: TlpA disulfide reductase family protein [Myxococcota bacterium]